MPDALSKMDNGLKEIFANYQYLKEKGWEDPGWLHPILETEGTHIVPVEIRFTGNLATIIENGLTIMGDPEDDEYVVAMVDLDFVTTIGSNPQILEMVYGVESTFGLDGSTVDINVRKTSEPGHTSIWEVNKATGAFNGNTGEGVIIGIIDTGIDFKHPVFMKNATETRILRIWDQGLIPEHFGEKPPDASLFAGAPAYGIEYKEAMINDVLQKKPNALNIRHKDCVGHGTHVASIAAGDGRAVEFLGSSGYEYVGVAPKASIIMVKHLALENVPAERPERNLLFDAIKYILKIAQELSQSVVINCSFGSDLGPHDGMERREVFLTNTFKQSVGKACVFAGGNASNRNQHAILKIPAAAVGVAPSIEVNFDFVDKRTTKTNKRTCVSRSTTRSRNIDIWYGNIAPAQLKFSVKLPNATAFTPSIELSKNVEDKINNILMVHEPRPSATPAGGLPINRNNFTLTVNPVNDSHNTGTYVIKIEGPANTELHVWCEQADSQNFSVSPNQSPAAQPGVKVTDNNTLGSLASSENVITVAAYDDVSGSIASFSSRGPLVKYVGNNNVLPDKPDIAAPGVAVNAAKGVNHDFPVALIKNMLGFKYINKNGTSMAAPHVAGLVALMLNKKKTLSSDEIKKNIQTFVRPMTPVEIFGKGKLDGKQVLDKT